MGKNHFKSLVSFSNKSINVDKDNGVIKNIVIVQQGANKNGSYFNQQFLSDLTEKGNLQKQGVKCRFGHPNSCVTSLGTFLGRYTNFSLNDNKVFADLTLDPITQKTEVEGKGISMWDYCLEMADNNPDMFGNSIVISSEVFEEQVGSEKFDSHKLHSFIASDLVDDPAATESLFSNSNDLGIVVTEFLNNNPSIFSVINKDPSIIEDFFERYLDYSNKYKSNFNMSFLDKLKKKFSNEETFDIEETTATGDVVKVITEGEKAKVGDSVVDEEGKPIADGDLVIKDGSTWVIANGTIEEIKEAESEEGAEEPTIAQVMQGVNNLSNSFNQFKSQYKKDLKENEGAIELVADQVEKFNTRLTTLARSVKSKNYDVPPGEETREGNRGSSNIAEEWKNKRTNKND
ncbi:hypothetical protein [Tenacibaculum sp. 190524A02b]|uniref:hypothetical protein n=1 Tax=Tenacibaculum vairaonense TaxID=3137860 RepID=UPI0031FAB3CB